MGHDAGMKNRVCSAAMQLTIRPLKDGGAMQGHALDCVQLMGAYAKS